MQKKSAKESSVTKKELGRLFGEQTSTILTAVDHRLEKFEARFEGVDRRFDAIDKRFDGVDHQFKTFEARFDAMDDRIEKMEMRFNKKLDQLMTTLDRFLKRMTDSEDEFIILKRDVNQIKAALKQKLGVDLF